MMQSARTCFHWCLIRRAQNSVRRGEDSCIVIAHPPMHDRFFLCACTLAGIVERHLRFLGG